MLRALTVRYSGAFVLAITIQAFSLGILSQSEARSLTDVLAQGFVFGAPSGEFSFAPGEVQSLVDFSAAGRAVAPAFSDAIAQAVTQEFPLASVSPAFIYRFNLAADTFERLTSVPGPIFAERALTLGKGRLNFGVGYAFVDYSEINGVDLDNIKSPGLIAEFFSEEESMPIDFLPETGETLFPLPLTLSQVRTKINLNAHIVAATVRYGVTDRWDVGLSIPIVRTYLRVTHEVTRKGDLASVRAVGTEGEIRLLDPAGNLIDFALPPEEFSRQLFQFVKSPRRSATLSRASGSATGVGDITLRTKYQFWQNGLGGGALGLNLQLPSGEEKDFHGTGETHLLTFVYLSRILREQFEPHLNLGIDFNADNVDRSSFLWAVGGTVLVWKKLGVMVDFFGRSEFERILVPIRPEDKVSGAILNGAPDTCTIEKTCFVADTVSFPAFSVKIKRNDIINFSFGLRYPLGNSGSIYFGGIVPLNDDGFRADFIPSGGVEYAF